jgi:hypothetical protein
MSEKRTFNEALATGQAYIDRTPLLVLKELQAAIGWSGGVGYVIRLGESTDSYLFKRLSECIAFHEGGDTILEDKNGRP